MTAQQSFNEALESLTGYEEDRIIGHYGADIVQMLSSSMTRATRALIFIEKVREGMKSDITDENKVVQAAKKYAQGLSIKQVSEYFQDDEEDADPFGLDEGESEPQTEAGKGADKPVNGPTS